MNKQEFVEDLAERCEFSKAEAGRAVNAILESLTEAMADGDEVGFSGFGKFVSQRRRAREGVNPQDRTQKIQIRDANVPKFRPGTALRKAASQAPAPAAGSGRARAASSGDGAAEAQTSQEAARSTSSGEPGWKPLGGRG